jgi:hypothetical protein
MRADGKLYVPDAERIIPHLARPTDDAHAHDVRIVASAEGGLVETLAGAAT